MKAFVLCAALSLAAVSAAAAAPPEDRSESGVTAWAKANGVKTDGLVYLGSTAQAAYFINKVAETSPNGPAEFTVYQERFDAKDGVSSERATLSMNCAGWQAKVADAKAFEGHGSTGKAGKSDPAGWTALAGADMEPIHRGSLLVPNRRAICQAIMAQRRGDADNVREEARANGEAKAEAARARMEAQRAAMANAPRRRR